MTDTMVERVARALSRACVDGCETEGFIEPCYAALCECRRFARVAVEAMREPTPGMKAAGADCYGQGRSWTGTWQGMIDAALKEAGHD